MPRTISTDLRDAVEASRSSEIVMFFVTISHDLLEVPIRVNSDLVDYVWNGNTYYGCGFTINLLSDDEQVPRADVAIENVDERIGQGIIALPDSPSIQIDLLLRSDFDSSVPRQPIGSPSSELTVADLGLRNVKCDALQITAEIYGTDLTAEPWPTIRSTPNRLPALGRG